MSTYVDFQKIGTVLDNSEEGKLFGKPCFKTNGKAYTCYFEEAMVFKLSDKAHSEALCLEGAELFDPSKKKRPMKEWVQIPPQHIKKWKYFAKAAQKYVSSL